MTALHLRKSISQSPLRLGLLLIPLTLVCFALSPTALAVTPAGDRDYANQNTAEGEDAHFSLTTDADNTAMGFDALDSTTTGSWIWRRADSLNTARYEHTATLLLNGMVLVAGGFDSNGNVSASAELYDPASRTWTATGSLNTAHITHTATLLQNGMVLVAGGEDSNFNILASAELYDPASGTWTATGSLNTARAFHTATLLQNGMVLVAGGADNSGVLTRAPNCTTRRAGPGRPQAASTPHAMFTRRRCYKTARSLLQGELAFPDVASAELYDPASGTWTATGSLNTGA